MDNNLNRLDLFLNGKTTPEETLELLAAAAADPALEEYVVNSRRAIYTNEQIEDYGSFIPAGSMAADDGQNLCDFQCEKFILRREGIEFQDEVLAAESRMNYWLRSQGTPLFNMGRLLEKNGLLVNRAYGQTMDDLKAALREHQVIVVVNGDTLLGKDADILSDDFSVEDNPDHAVAVLSVSEENGTVTLYNPATDAEDTTSEYGLERFASAWEESRNYMVTARAKKTPYEYNPQPLDVSSVNINPELMELIELIAENAHDVWAVDKMKAGFSYAPADPVTGKEKDGNFNHYLIPYTMLEEKDKEPDRKMALQTIKLVKRLGYRLVNINSMHKCPSCGNVIEPDHNFCSRCGAELSWEDFR